MNIALLKFESVHPSELVVGDTVQINGGLKTVGGETVKSGYCGTLVDGIRTGSIERVLFPKWYKGEVTGYYSQI